MQNNAVTVTYIRGINLIASDVDGVRTYYLYNAHGDVVGLMLAFQQLRERSWVN
ncbi:hypothetical protein SDC9_123681 [bioreactor metagenome]|uniref:Uncharacterized protein n=1 Tax=bioreactor metagenome TaxID=1076179 RepID=A0A645CIT2_9ZZZZ|nr:hypothetical protein [Oscillospiraceae bacterium]